VEKRLGTAAKKSSAPMHSRLFMSRNVPDGGTQGIGDRVRGTPSVVVWGAACDIPPYEHT
jgi:hypothetical protein